MCPRKKKYWFKHRDIDKFLDEYNEVPPCDPDVYLEEVRKKGKLLGCVKDKTFDICMAAVQQNGGAIKYVPEQFEKYIELYIIAINNPIFTAFRNLKIGDPKRLKKIPEHLRRECKKHLDDKKFMSTKSARTISSEIL